MKSHKFFALLFVCVLAGCATVNQTQNSSVTATKPTVDGAQERRDQLIGKWYGEAATRDGGKRVWLTERKPDGRFRIDFVTRSLVGQPEVSVEVGLWGISGPIYFTITQGWLAGNQFTPADPQDASFYDAYQVVNLENDRFTYKNVETGNIFTVRKVTSDFVLPKI